MCFVACCYVKEMKFVNVQDNFLTCPQKTAVLVHRNKKMMCSGMQLRISPVLKSATLQNNNVKKRVIFKRGYCFISIQGAFVILSTARQICFVLFSLCYSLTSPILALAIPSPKTKARGKIFYGRYYHFHKGHL